MAANPEGASEHSSSGSEACRMSSARLSENAVAEQKKEGTHLQSNSHNSIRPCGPPMSSLPFQSNQRLPQKAHLTCDNEARIFSFNQNLSIARDIKLIPLFWYFKSRRRFPLSSGSLSTLGVRAKFSKDLPFENNLLTRVLDICRYARTFSTLYEKCLSSVQGYERLERVLICGRIPCQEFLCPH